MNSASARLATAAGGSSTFIASDFTGSEFDGAGTFLGRPASPVNSRASIHGRTMEATSMTPLFAPLTSAGTSTAA
jgi:hypothetical protein